ncbi:MAG: NAD(P)H-hydrate dehydratase [Lachnospiraceae bacterium]|nr:NAD(P)H-hydrate dehydratase [Lachnospiraceae bacterium]
MQYIVTKQEMQVIDTFAIEYIGIPDIVMMERAALKLVKQIEKVNSNKGRILIVVEGGNNGGDGLAAARILLERGYAVDIYYIGELTKTTEAFQLQMIILKNMNISFSKGIPDKDYSIIVDGIFGVGLSRKIEGVHKEIIDALNSMEGIKIAIDMPTGIDATTGDILGAAFKADYTVTFVLKKLGMFFSDGIDYCGEVVCTDIGLPRTAIEEIQPKIYAYDQSDMDKIPKRYNNSHKGTYGKVAVIAGSKNMSGAAFLCGKAAYSVGAGLVKIYTHESNRTIVQSQLPEAVMMTYEEYGGALACVEDVLKWATVIVVGPGLGVDTTSERMLYELMMRAEVPMVLDADALNILSNNIELLESISVPVVMTPHMKEMSRLIDKTPSEIMDNRFEIARDFAKKTGVTLVLKDAKSVVTDGGEQSYINLAGNNGMSTGGSGDVLSGIIAGMIAGGLSLAEAAKMGTFVHCMAGDKAAEEKGKYAMLASDILNHIEDVLR